MDKLLNHGKYEIEGESKIVNQDTQIGWKIFLMGEEFTKQIKLFIFSIMRNWFMDCCFLIGTIAISLTM